MSVRLDALLLRALETRSSHLGTTASDGLDAAAIREHVFALARKLLARHVERDEPIILKIRNEPSDVVGFLGIWHAGAVAVPLHVASAEATHATLLSRTCSRFEVDAGEVLTFGNAPPAHRPSLCKAAVIVFTSGSTGRPKGVIVGHQALIFKLGVLSRLLNVSADDVLLCPLQLTFIFGLWVSLLGLLSGARVVLVPKFSVASVAEGLRSCTILAAVPTMLRTITAGNAPEAPRLRRIFTGGEPFGPALAATLKAAFPNAGAVDLFGLTETGSCDFCLSWQDQPHGFGTIGRPTEGVDFRIQPVAATTLPGAGELQIRTPARMIGYLDDPQLTEAAFDGDYFCTGDLARVREDGLVELIGRSKDIVSRGGNKIAPLELDNLFAQHPDVAAALCVGIPDTRLGEALHLIVVRRDGATVTADDLRHWAANQIERFKLPDAIHFYHALPAGRTGKADRQAAIAAILADLQQ